MASLHVQNATLLLCLQGRQLHAETLEQPTAADMSLIAGGLMKRHLRMLWPVLASCCFVTCWSPGLTAQITNAIQAHVNHSFLIGDKTLPPGDYTFRMMDGSDLSIMTVSTSNGKGLAVFHVESAIDNHTPRHSELVFKRYGNTEFLSKIFEVGSKTGVGLTETSKEEERLVNGGQHAMEHSEEQK
jgi:hypothetical protein